MSAPLREGYKQTEVGVIPVEWTLVRFADLFEFRNGVNAEKHAYGKGTRFINVLEVITHSHLRADDIPGRISLSKSAINAFSVQYGDIVFNRTSETQEEVGLSAVYWDAEPVVFGGFVIRGRPKSDVLDVGYSGDALRAPIIRSQVIAKGQGAIRSNVGQADLRQVLAPLPPLPEQRAIATALSDVDALISAQDALIAKKRDLKQAAMQELLTGKRRLPGFSGDWEVKPFGDIFDYLPTATNSRSDLSDSGDTYYIHYGDIHTRFHSRLDFRNQLPSMIMQKRCGNAAFLKNGDWVMADASEDYDGVCKAIEIAGIQDGMQAVSGLHTFLLREKTPTFAAGFKGHLGNLHSLHQQYLRVATGMKVFGVSKAALKDLVLSIPKPAEQTAIATILSDMDAELAGLCARRDKTRALKQGMMQELLTGRIRLL